MKSRINSRGEAVNEYEIFIQREKKFFRIFFFSHLLLTRLNIKNYIVKL